MDSKPQLVTISMDGHYPVVIRPMPDTLRADVAGGKLSFRFVGDPVLYIKLSGNRCSRSPCWIDSEVFGGRCAISSISAVTASASTWMDIEFTMIKVAEDVRKPSTATANHGFRDHPGETDAAYAARLMGRLDRNFKAATAVEAGVKPVDILVTLPVNAKESAGQVAAYVAKEFRATAGGSFHGVTHKLKYMETQPVIPAVLHDGMSTADCARKWAENRASVERGAAPVFVLTKAQAEVGRLAYQKDALAEWSAELRGKVETSRGADEARETSVIIDMEVE